MAGRAKRAKQIVSDDVAASFARNVGAASAADLPPAVRQLIADGRFNEAAELMAKEARVPLAGSGGGGGLIPPQRGVMAPASPAPQGGGPRRPAGVRVVGAENPRPAGVKDAPTQMPQEPLGDAIRAILKDRERMRAWELGAGLAGAGLLYDQYRRSQSQEPETPEPVDPREVIRQRTYERRRALYNQRNR